MEIHAIDLSGPDGIEKLLKLMIGPSVSEAALMMYRQIQHDLQETISDLVSVYNVRTKTGDRWEDDEVLSRLNPRQLGLALSLLFDAYENLLAAVDPKGDPELAEMQQSCLVTTRKMRQLVFES